MNDESTILTIRAHKLPDYISKQGLLFVNLKGKNVNFDVLVKELMNLFEVCTIAEYYKNILTEF